MRAYVRIGAMCQGPSQIMSQIILRHQPAHDLAHPVGQRHIALFERVRQGRIDTLRHIRLPKGGVGLDVLLINHKNNEQVVAGGPGAGVFGQRI